MRHPTRNCHLVAATALILCGALAFGANQAAAQPPMNNDGLAQFTQRQNQLPNPDIGKSLPPNLTVLDSNNQTVALRNVIHGPAVIIKTFTGCPPCSALLSYVQNHGEQYIHEHGAQIVVLSISTPSAAPADSIYPKGVLTFHTPGMMTGGILGGTNLPAMYFLDKNLTLVAVHSGVYNASDAAMAAALSFPRTTTK